MIILSSFFSKGKGFEASSTLIFLLLLLLISKGYTITRARLKQKTISKFAMFMIMSTVAYAIIFYNEQYVRIIIKLAARMELVNIYPFMSFSPFSLIQLFDPGEVLYLYESSFGYLLISLRLLAWSWFAYAIVFTLLHYPHKSAFFAKLFLVYSIWYFECFFLLFVPLILNSFFLLKGSFRHQLLF